MNRTLSTMGGDAQPIDEADILENALGSSGSHTRGVDRVESSSQYTQDDNLDEENDKDNEENEEHEVNEECDD
ncbi:hypothetical protein QVD17_16882 [Tagetes erecta]|uniref:Uncharacterized protein n=1 Tax=Tagetes erecta TaxID=13708 RepID=A0AAD8NTV0_TARER|nr:hypothetical protein QVD17_16882 [Tagetes erecta]